jgi:ATP-dependent helicase/DNAse subunit B
MAIHLYTAPAGIGKTAYLVDRARALAADAGTMPRVVVATRLQARSWQRRLAETGGALGVHIGTFDRLYDQILSGAGEAYTRISDAVQYRLLRALIATVALAHYAPLRDAPGFVQEVARLIDEWKAGGIRPEALREAVTGMGGEPRLAELADLYLAYQRRLRDERWADAAGAGWLAAETLARQPEVGRAWPALYVDGFDNLTTVQLRVLRELAGRVGELIVTLTGAAVGRPRETVHRRFYEARDAVERALGVRAEHLPGLAERLGMHARPLAEPETPARAPALAHLEATLYLDEEALPPAADGALALVAAPDREGEVRAALRWLKRCSIEGAMSPAQVALLARDLAPYRAWILQVASEYGVPVQVVGGLALRTNPAVAALLDLLRLPVEGDAGAGSARGAYPWRETVAAWRSPYFGWAMCAGGDGAATGIDVQDAERLDWVARWGSVIGGLGQWEEAFGLLAEVGDPRAGPPTPEESPHPNPPALTGIYDRPGEEKPRPALPPTWERLDEEMPEVPERVPVGRVATALWAKFERFVQRVTPPIGPRSYRDHVRWVEELVGGPGAEPEDRGEALRHDLGMVRCVEAGPAEVRERDLAALEALKDVLRGLVWAEEALGGAPVSYSTFVDDLAGAVDAATYRVPLRTDEEAVLVADMVQARGLPFRAVAVLGLAEGEFPTALVEDPFLRDADRRELRDGYALPLDLSTESAEAGYFYEAVTRASERLLLTRPRIADNGAPWQASPFWEEARRRVMVEPVRLTSSQQPAPQEAASWPELLLGVAARGVVPGGGDGVASAAKAASGGAVANAARAAQQEGAVRPERAGFEQMAAGAAILYQRTGPAHATEGAGAAAAEAGAGPTPHGSAYDGDLTAWGATFAQRFGRDHVWSASRLESYRACPHLFFWSHVLGLEPRTEPSEGLDARQLGNLYHRIMERVYRAVDDTSDLEALLDALPDVAEPILDAAPRREGFRATAWWAQTREEIVEHARRSLVALHALLGAYVPDAFELAFGMGHGSGPALVVRDADGGDWFRLRGFIDRVDRAPDGSVRVVDYKTGGPWGYTRRAIEGGEKLQLPLYALAAEEALALGTVNDGFYWHVRHADWHTEHAASSTWFTLDKAGAREAIERAVRYAWEAVRGARRGAFTSQPPEDGCPSYCPAAGFCPRYAAYGW